MKLELSLFRFDYKSDYLPYYTKNYIKIKNQRTLLDILNEINMEHPFGYERNEEFAVSINGVYTKLSVSVNEIVENFGNDIVIEPLSIRRSHTDLLINDADFKQRLSVLADFIDNEDIKRYEDYKIYFYASNTINFEYDYIGDSILLLASDLIEKDPSNEKEILDAILDYECGAEYYTSLENRVYNFDKNISEKIDSIRKKLNLLKSIDEQNFNLEKASKIEFGSFENVDTIKHNFEDFNIAYYTGLNSDLQVEELLSRLDAKIIKTDSMKFDLALDSFHINSDFTLKIASTIMLDAFDNAADFILVNDEKIFTLFDSNRNKMSQISGREVILPVIHVNELAKLVLGKHDDVKPLLQKHRVDPEII